MEVRGQPHSTVQGIMGAHTRVDELAYTGSR